MIDSLRSKNVVLDKLEKNDLLFDKKSLRIGRYTGYDRFSKPPYYEVVWLDDDRYGKILKTNCERFEMEPQMFGLFQLMINKFEHIEKKLETLLLRR